MEEEGCDWMVSPPRPDVGRLAAAQAENAGEDLIKWPVGLAGWVFCFLVGGRMVV